MDRLFMLSRIFESSQTIAETVRVHLFGQPTMNVGRFYRILSDVMVDGIDEGWPILTGKNLGTWRTVAGALIDRAPVWDNDPATNVTIDREKIASDVGFREVLGDISDLERLTSFVYGQAEAEDVDRDTLDSGARGITVGEAFEILAKGTRQLRRSMFLGSFASPNPHWRWLDAAERDFREVMSALGESSVSGDLGTPGEVPADVPWSDPRG